MSSATRSSNGMRSSATSSQGSSSPYTRRSMAGGLGPLPPPPPGVAPSQNNSSSYSQSIAKSMTIDEMRQLHQRALRDAEAKRTELRLVLASRYRELVGSSDEVIKMNERSQELHDLVRALPGLLEKVNHPGVVTTPDEETTKQETKGDDLLRIRRNLSLLPRLTHRALDVNDVHKATTTLIELFTLIASLSDAYPLAQALSTGSIPRPSAELIKDPPLQAQLRMIYLQVETLPRRIGRIASKNLLRSASYGRSVENPSMGAHHSAAALLSLDLLEIKKPSDRAGYLLDLYFESKAKLLVSLLNKLQSPKTDGGKLEAASTGQAEKVLSKIVLILQHDALLHPYQIFVLRNFPCQDPEAVARITKHLPTFDKALVRAKCSKFMASHLPLIRTKVKTVLVSIAGTTASALGQIRQSLYDRTDGAQLMERLNANGVCTWDDAVEAMVDIRTVLNSADMNVHRFSLWNALFSNTFSSLVHSLLTTAFQSVHTKVVSTLRTSVANAPPAASILPHEAYRNTLQIATDLNRALLKVSEDAHELLVHAEEREESLRRLKESLYVHSCEILGRLVCELRRMVNDASAEATKELIVGRLCHLLKFRLTALPTLLDPASSPAALQSTSGMISYVDLQSAFELGDHDEVGIISFEEALQAVESAFSGTQFHGADMVRETLLLSTSVAGAQPDTPKDVTLDELVLLTARGLRHETAGTESALGAFQRSLDKISDVCFIKWAKASLEIPSKLFASSMRESFRVGSSVTESEWNRLYGGSDVQGLSPRNVSAHLVGYILAASSVLNCNTCPSDFLPPVLSIDYASTLGVVPQGDNQIATLMHSLRWAILQQVLSSITSQVETTFQSATAPGGELQKHCPSSLVQLRVDVSFIAHCFLERSRDGLGPSRAAAELLSTSTATLDGLCKQVDAAIKNVSGIDVAASLEREIRDQHAHVLHSSDLFFASLLGETKSSVSAAGEVVGGTNAGSEPIFHMPLSSSRRFAVLPVPADRSVNEIQLRGKYAKDKEESGNHKAPSSGNVVSSGLGFLSNMLKTR